MAGCKILSLRVPIIVTAHHLCGTLLKIIIMLFIQLVPWYMLGFIVRSKVDMPTSMVRAEEFLYLCASFPLSFCSQFYDQACACGWH